MIDFKCKRINNHGWRRGSCKKQKYGFSKVRTFLLDYEGTRISNGKLWCKHKNFKPYSCRKELDWEMIQRFLLKNVGRHINDAYSDFRKIYKRDVKGFLTYKDFLRYFINMTNERYPNRFYIIDEDGYIQVYKRIPDAYNSFFKPKQVNKKYIRENNVGQIQLTCDNSSLVYLGEFWVITVEDNKFIPHKVPVWSIYLKQRRFWDPRPIRAQDENSKLNYLIKTRYRRVTIVGLPINKFPKHLLYTKIQCLKSVKN